MQVTVEDYFVGGSEYQHLVVRATNGVVFELPKTDQSLVKVARIFDFSQVTANLKFTLDGEWSQVERVLGSNGFKDIVTGNALGNYLDPGNGGCYLTGQNGSDTYVIRNGTDNSIDNYAEDDQPDTLQFVVPFFSISASVCDHTDIKLTSNTSRGNVSARLINYASEPKSRHLTVVTEDDYTFVLPPSRNYTPVAIIINKLDSGFGQVIDLTLNSKLSDVRTVYGSRDYSNYIIGNQQNNTIVGGSRADSLQGLEGDDTIKGGAGGDILQGGPGNDIILGGDGDDVINGGEGNDVIFPGHGFNRVTGGNGIDTLVYGGKMITEQGIDVILKHYQVTHDGDIQDIIVAIENVYGTEFDDILEGDDEDNVLVGQGGNDILVPGAGYDLLEGGDGYDTYDLSAANGTVTISNYATDDSMDEVVMAYDTVQANLRYEKAGNDLVVRVIDPKYLVFFDGTKPTVVFKGWYLGTQYQHAQLFTDDGTVGPSFLRRRAISPPAKDASILQMDND